MAKSLTPDERTKLLELEAELQRHTLRATLDTLHGAKGITWALAGVSLVTRFTVMRKARLTGYALIAGRMLLRARRARRDRKRPPP